ncbi:hypothetical protein RND71_023239 [Anisodus tanguticus]|uniref:Uncharacterized protein n=1 Tax=Anisodus tanguticus TaxID=243964 RepID=A0AAE1RS91_9SOLA|nr:hypothetical protein RND71_023239 [Anisodus tanguticus]
MGIQEAKLLQLPSACKLTNASISSCPIRYAGAQKVRPECRSRPLLHHRASSSSLKLYLRSSGKPFMRGYFCYYYNNLLDEVKGMMTIHTNIAEIAIHTNIVERVIHKNKMPIWPFIQIENAKRAIHSNTKMSRGPYIQTKIPKGPFTHDEVEKGHSSSLLEENMSQAV